jgi:predicted nucleic acid-binding protein
MTRSVFVDTNVFIYARDRRLPDKQSQAALWLRALGARNAGMTSPQVAGEFLNVISRGKLALDERDLRSSMALIERWSAGETSLEVVAEGWRLRQETGFQFWDCVILASAIRAGCSYLLSEDYQSGRSVRGTTIISPFDTDPTLLD